MADTGETPTKEHKEQRYLSLDPRGEFDPRIATLPARLYKLFVQMRMMALSSDTPGVLDIAWAPLCECLGVRSPALQERYAQKLEERGLIGIRKDDEAIVLARWTMPQLEAQGFRREPLPPRRRYPSDDRRKQTSRDTEKETEPQSVLANARDCALESLPNRPADAPPSPALRQFWDDANTANSGDAESGAEACGAEAESARSQETNPKKERKKEAKACPPPPPGAESAAESSEAGQAGRPGGQGTAFVSETERREVEQALLAQRVHAGNAHSLAYAPDLNAGQVYAQIAALPDRQGADPPGLLVTAIRQNLPLPPAYLERLEGLAARQQQADAQAEADRLREERLRASDAKVARALAANASSALGVESEERYAAL